MQRYDILLMDADDTILDFGKAEHAAIKNTLEAFGQSATDELTEIYSKINKSCWKQLERGELDKLSLRYVRFEKLCEMCGICADPKKMGDFYLSDLAKHAFLIDGAKELCELLSKKCRIYIITNGIKSVQTGRMHRCGLDRIFLKCFISEDIGYEKPDVRFFDSVAASIDGFDKRRTLVIGDSLTSDIKGGINFGVDTCWYNPRGLSGEGMTYNIRNYEELKKIIFG